MRLHNETYKYPKCSAGHDGIPSKLLKYIAKIIAPIALIIINQSLSNGMFQEITDRLRNPGAVSIRKTVLPGMAIPMLKIRRPNGRLIFNMEIAIRR